MRVVIAFCAVVLKIRGNSEGYTVSSLSIPYSTTDLGFKLSFSGRPSSKELAPREVRTSPQAKEELVAPRVGGLELLPAEVQDIQRRSAQVTGALASLERQHEAIQDQRFSRLALASYAVIGLWNRATSWLRLGAAQAASTPNERATKLERAISDNVSELKRLTERVVVPALTSIREEYRGRTFTRDADTSKALLLVSVPTEKVGKMLSFDSLRISVDARAIGSKATCDISRGEGRIVLQRTGNNGEREQLEFSYKRPGKVDVYLNGQRRGSMWNDDALDLCDAFQAGRAIPLEKRMRSTEYTVC
jgi:hypothetical protein